MKTKAVFYHAGCPVCLDAERTIVDTIDRVRFDVEVVHLGEQKERIAEAEGFGVNSVPALAIAGRSFHINFGASLQDLK